MGAHTRFFDLTNTKLKKNQTLVKIRLIKTFKSTAYVQKIENTMYTFIFIVP